MKKICKLKLNIINLVEGFRADERFFKEIAKKTLKLIDLSADECTGGVLAVDLAFVDEAEIKKINKEWRGKNKPTDVLSFSEIMTPQGHLAKELKLGKKIEDKKSSPKSKLKYFIGNNLMQIIICPDYAKKQAKKFRYSQKQELAMLMAHGILHVLGYDHERSSKEEEVMWAVQDKIIGKLK